MFFRLFPLAIACFCSAFTFNLKSNSSLAALGYASFAATLGASGVGLLFLDADVVSNIKKPKKLWAKIKVRRFKDNVPVVFGAGLLIGSVINFILAGKALYLSKGQQPPVMTQEQLRNHAEAEHLSRVKALKESFRNSSQEHKAAQVRLSLALAERVQEKLSSRNKEGFAEGVGEIIDELCANESMLISGLTAAASSPSFAPDQLARDVIRPNLDSSKVIYTKINSAITREAADSRSYLVLQELLVAQDARIADLNGLLAGLQY